MDCEYCIAEEVSAEIKVKGSKFIAHAAPIENRAAAEAYVQDLSDRYRDATHNCFAYRIGFGAPAESRFSDAGEPSGTAGRPILQAIEAKTLSNVVVVVTRYFGGTKLGTGGLIRAYSAAACAALNKAHLLRYSAKTTLRLTFDYELSNSVHSLIARYDAGQIETQYDEQTVYLVKIKSNDEQAFRDDLQDVSSGRIRIERISSEG